MVQVNKIKKPTQPATSQPATQQPAATPTAPVIQSSSTAAPIPASLQKASQGFALPAFLEKEHKGIELASQELSGYVGFAHPQSKRWGEMVSAGLESGDPFMCRDNQFIKCKPLQYFLVEGEAFRSTMVGQDSKITFLTRDLDTPAKELEGLYPGKARVGAVGPEPHYVCLMLVFHNGALVPIKSDIRSTKTGAVEGPTRAIELAATGEWANQGQLHKLSMMFPKPWGRAFHTVTTHPKVGKASGNNFHVCSAKTEPTNVDMMKLLYESFKDEDFNRELALAYENYESRIAHFDKIIQEIGA